MRIAEKPSREDTPLSFWLFASFCGGEKRRTDREHLSGPADDPGSGNPASLAGKVLFGKLPPRTALSSLETQKERMAGYEVAGVATGSAFSFASTYAMGHLAEKYYSGVRTLAAKDRKPLLASLSEEGKQLHARYLPEIEARSKTLNPFTIFSLVQGKQQP